MSVNKFGGNWTGNKIDILVDYAKAYLSIMNYNAQRYNWNLMYFDGFAGSGYIVTKNNKEKIAGATLRILEIDTPRSFDMYYFVEKDENIYFQLNSCIEELFPNKTNIFVVNTDGNEKIQSLSSFLSANSGRKYKVLAYIDPCGMQLNWESIKALQEKSIDVWILVPTGMGVNRLLKKNGNISDAWLHKLEVFLGMDRESILSYFYHNNIVRTLFGDEIIKTKEERAIEKSAELYKSRLNELFKYVSEPYVLKNKTNSIMFHFYMASNNKTAVNIANDIIVKYNGDEQN